MGKGLQVAEGKKLVMFNARLAEEKRALLAALVSVSWVDSSRELIDEFLELFEKAYPETLAKAEALLALTQEGAGKE